MNHAPHEIMLDQKSMEFTFFALLWHFFSQLEQPEISKFLRVGLLNKVNFLLHKRKKIIK